MGDSAYTYETDISLVSGANELSLSDPDGEDNFDEYFVESFEVTNGTLQIDPDSSSPRIMFIEIETIPEPGTVLLLIPGLGALAAWRRRDGLRFRLPSKSGGLTQPGSLIHRCEGKSFGAVVERLSRLFNSLTPRFAFSLNLMESDRLLHGFERAETLLRNCRERLSTACNRTADRFWSLIVR